MSGTTRFWKGVGPLALGGLMLSAAAALADGSNPISDQLTGLGEQALAQGQPGDAAEFFRKALEINPENVEARKALASPELRLAQAPPPAEVGTDLAPPSAVDPTASPAPIDGAAPAERVPTATLEYAQGLERVATQRLTSQTRERIQQARTLLEQDRVDDSLQTLQLALAAVRSEDSVPATVRESLIRELDVAIQTTTRRGEEIELVRAERLRLAAAATQRARILADAATNQETVNAMMTRFDALLNEGFYNVLFNAGVGDIAASTAPFYTARLLAQQARALEPRALAPRAGVYVSQTENFLAQSIMFEEVKEFRFMMTLNDVLRAAIPFPDTITIEYPDAEEFKRLTEKRIKRVRVGRPRQPRPQDHRHPREAGPAALDAVRQRDAPGRRPEVHQDGEREPAIAGRHSDLRRPRRSDRSRKDHDLTGHH